MKFQDFYYTKHPEQKKIDDVIQEMSLRIGSIANPLRDTVMNYQITQVVKKDGLFIESWKANSDEIYDVYSYNNPTEINTTYNFVFDDKLTVAKINFEEIDGGIQIDAAYSKGGAWSGLVTRIYTDYLLNKYSFILSDNSHTESGFNIYRELVNIQSTKNITVSVVDQRTDEEIRIYNIKELEKYFGNTVEFAYFRFIVRKL